MNTQLPMNTAGESVEADDPLIEIAAGRGDPAMRLFVEAAAEMRGCADGFPAAFGGGLIEREAPCELASDALDRVFAAIDASEAAIRSVSAASRRPAEAATFPLVVQDAVRDAERAGGWKFAGPGIRVLPLQLGGRATAEILRIAPGAATPRHTHSGMEYTLCLSGGFSDGRGSYGPGDVAVASPDVTHKPVADEDGPCFVLALTDSELRFTGVMGLVQRMMGG